MFEDDYYPLTFDDDDELGFFSIFDDYNEASHELEKRSLLVDSPDEVVEKQEEVESSDDEVDLKKKWKVSVKTIMNKYDRFYYMLVIYMKKFRVNYIFICSQLSAIGMRNFKANKLFIYFNYTTCLQRSYSKD